MNINNEDKIIVRSIKYVVNIVDESIRLCYVDQHADCVTWISTQIVLRGSARPRIA